MNPFIFAAITSVISLGAGIVEGRERRRQAEQAAYDTELEKKQLALQAIEEENARVRQYAELEATALALGQFANNAQNVDTLLDKSLEDLNADVDRLGTSSLLKSLRLQAQADEYRRSGRVAQTVSNLNTFASFTNSLYRGKDTWTPKTFNLIKKGFTE